MKQRRRVSRRGFLPVGIRFANDGVAGVPGVLRVTLESMDGRVRLSGGLEAGHPYGGRLQQVAFVLPNDMEGKQMKLYAELETKGVRRLVRWACAQPLAPNAR